MMEIGEDGGIDYNQMIGSIMERWLTTPCKGKCRFCRKPVSEKLTPQEQFCSEECKKNWKKVMEARIVLGKRDLNQRGYD